MARVMEGKRVLFLGHHGVIVIGRTVAETFDDLYYLERASQVQVMAASMGEPLVMPEEVARATAAQFTDRAASAERHFIEVKAILDAEEPEYAS